MRLNRGTITLLVGSALVIIAVLLFNSVATAPGSATATATGSAGPLFDGLEADAVARLEIASNTNGDHTVLLKDAGGAWGITEVTYGTDRAVQQDSVSEAITGFADLQANDSFVAENLADFGLDQPDYVITAQAGETTYTIYVGNQNPTGNRYYVLIATGQAEAITPPPAAEEPTTEATAETTETPAEATSAATEEVTAEATEAATAAATEEVTAEATAEVTEAPAEATSVATEEVTAEATAEAAEETPQEATAEAEPTFTPLTFASEGQTVYLVNKSALDDLIDLITAPPYVPPPTSTPTPYPTPNPYSEVEQTATAVIVQTATAEFHGTATAEFAATLTATAQPTEQLASTVEVTAEEATPTPTPTPTPQ